MWMEAFFSGVFSEFFEYMAFSGGEGKFFEWRLVVSVLFFVRRLGGGGGRCVF